MIRNGGTCKEIMSDQTKKYKNRLINLLQKIKIEGGISDILYKMMYPTGAVAPNFMDCPKFIRDISLRPIVATRGTTTYEMAKDLAKVMRLLVGKYPHHVKNQQWEYISSYDVCTPHIIANRSCQFQGRYFEKLQGAAVRSPISPIVAKPYMEDFEIKVINTAKHHPTVWKKYVDDSFVVIRSSEKASFLEPSTTWNHTSNSQ